MTPSSVVGLDLSLTCTGLCKIIAGEINVVTAIKTNTKQGTRIKRCETIAKKIMARTEDTPRRCVLFLFIAYAPMSPLSPNHRDRLLIPARTRQR